MKFYKFLTLLFLFMSLSALAQGPGGMGKGRMGQRDPMGMMIKSLDLTADQLAKIKELRKTHWEKMKAKRNEMKAGANHMFSVMSATETEDSLRTSYKKFQALKDELDKERFEMMLSIRKILTEEQRKKASELMQSHREKMGSRMKDGPPDFDRP